MRKIIGNTESKFKRVNNNLIAKTKVLTYSIFTLIFIATSYLSVLYIGKHFSSKSSFFTFESLSPIILISLGVLLVFYFLLDALRFLYVMKTIQIEVSLGYLLKLAFINMFLSNITPFATGGAFAQIYFLNKKQISIGDATAATTIKTVLPIIFFFITTPMILIADKSLFKIIRSDNNLIYILSLVAMYILACYGFYKVLKNTSIIKKKLFNILVLLENKKIIPKNKVERFRNSSFLEIDIFAINIKRFLKGKRQYILLSIIFMILYLFALFSFPVILIRGYNSNISTSQIISLQILLTFITYFAPTPGATGVAEGGFTLMFSNFVDKSDIVSLTFSWRFFTMYLGILIGLIIFYGEIVKNKFSAKVI
ncbi:flippase-like domain-containing protein [Clostridium bowmanii]|uniref:lysylphosphatidylglycerol synthase transmembrane domain-containing protein n=1 Tax=Clostridium bowmanii TaxID=132925 RepID=UPI001C0AA389|nr:lysylphosphatidylglycerol synthase transmembrane domain-containing protein [Clostridium bowmanii]MBU3188068.1 flippase-like domain-containing protein [Clostridium bowmanii]MCA1072249.1 flippase-like domain-containing protein [Clostridium bowmanii]